MSQNEALETALAAAAEALPSHFAGGEELTLEALTAIQATTLSLPGGAIGIESVVKGHDVLGSVVLIVTGLVDHNTGEILDRSEAREKWSVALESALGGLKESLGDFPSGQIHMTDAFDVLEKADEATVVGVFSGQTLAALLLTQPAKATGQGAAAELAAAIAQAEAEAEERERAEAAERDDSDDSDSPHEGPDGDNEGNAGEDEPSADEDAEVGASVADDEAAVAAQAGSPAQAAAGGAPGQGQVDPSQLDAAQFDPAQLAAAQAYLLQQAAAAAEQGAAQGPQATFVPPPPRDPRGPAAGQVMTLTPLTGAFTYSVDPRRLDLLRDVMMGVSVELGRTRMPVQQILGLIPGSIIELDRAAGAPVDVLVNGKLIAHGEVVVVDEEFAVRISEICSGDGEGQVSA